MDLYIEIAKLFPQISAYLTPEEIAHLKNTPAASLQSTHNDLIPWIKEGLLPSAENRLHFLFKEFGIHCENEMSSMVLELYHTHLSHLR
jgi:hypothetical protein